MIRVFHNTTITNAQKNVDFVTSRKIPLVWDTGEVKRILNPEIKLKDQILLLVSSSSLKTKTEDLFNWIENPNKKYFMQTLRGMHSSRLIELSNNSKEAEILPPDALLVEKLLAKLV